MCSPITSTPKRSGHKCMSCEANVSDITRNDAYKTANNGNMSEPRMEICFQVTPGDPNISHYLNILADLQPVLYRGRSRTYCNSQSTPSCNSTSMSTQHQAIESCGQAGAVFNVYQSPRSTSPGIQQSPGFRIYEDSPPGAVSGRSHAGAGFQIFQDSPDASINHRGGNASKCAKKGHSSGGTVLSAVGIGTAAGAAGRSFRIFEDDPSPKAHCQQLDIQIRHNKQAAADFLGNNIQKRKPFGNRAGGSKIHNPYVLPQIYPKCSKRDSIKKTPCRRVTAQGRRLVMNACSPCSSTRTKKSRTRQKRHGKDQITKNPFFNYLREYRRKNCDKTVIEAAVEGAKIWKCMSLEEKCPYKLMVLLN